VETLHWLLSKVHKTFPGKHSHFKLPNNHFGAKMLKAEKRVGFILHVGSLLGLFLLMNDVHAISIGGSVNCLRRVSQKMYED